MTRLAAWLLAAVALAGPGCASFSEYRARAAHQRTELERFRYRQPLEVVWPQVQRLLADRGLDLAGKDAAAVGQSPGVLTRFSSAARETRSTPAGGLVLETGWNENGVRWRAVAEPQAGGLRVVLTRIEVNRDQFGSDGVTLRDYDLELELLFRVDPEAAEPVADPAAPPRAPAALPPSPAAPPSRSAGPPGP